MGLQRARHDWASNIHTNTCSHQARLCWVHFLIRKALKQAGRGLRVGCVENDIHSPSLLALTQEISHFTFTNSFTISISSVLNVYGILCIFFRKQKMEKKDHRGIDCGRFPIAIQDKMLHPDSVLGKLRGSRGSRHGSSPSLGSAYYGQNTCYAK